MYDNVIYNVNLATMQADAEDGYGIITDAVVAIKDGKIAAIFDRSDERTIETEHSIDAEGCWLTPGLIDCHTHLIYAGNRANEFEQRLNGVSYEEIARQGGGIRATVSATRAASKDELFTLAAKRLSYFIDQGVTTLEIKSGYGLDLENEQKMLEVAAELERCSPVEISKTFLGAHALPPEYSNKDDYIDYVCNIQLPALARAQLVDCVDVFCESIGFDLEQTRRVFAAAQSLQLPVKLHAEQLSSIGGSELAASYGAWSVDHIEYLPQQAIPHLKESGTVATLLPGAFYYLREKQLPPVTQLRQQQVPIAIASDCNPGSSPCLSLLTIMNMGCVLFGLTPAETLAGVTRNAAKALRLDDRLGVLQSGYQADLALWQIEHPAELSYIIGHNPCLMVIKKGQTVLDRRAQN